MRPLIVLLALVVACNGGDPADGTDSPDGTDSTDDTDVFVPAPVIATVDPMTGLAGTLITITGTDLGATEDDVTVRIGDLAVDLASHTPTELSFELPAEADDGLLSVETAGGTSETDEVFDVIFAPVVTDVRPGFGLVGDEIGIHGTHFGDDVEDVVVFFTGIEGRARAEVLDKLDDRLIVAVPAGAADGPIAVATSETLVGESAVDFDVTDTRLEVSSCARAIHIDGPMQCSGAFDTTHDVEISYTPLLEGTAATVTAGAVQGWVATEIDLPDAIGTYEITVRNGLQEVAVADPVVVYDWVQVTGMRGRMPDGTFVDEPAVGREFAMFFSPGTAITGRGPTHLELLDDAGTVVWTARGNGGYGSTSSGTYGIKVSAYDGPTGTFHGRVVWDDPESDATMHSPITPTTVTIVAGE